MPNPPMQRTGAAGIFSAVRKLLGRGSATDRPFVIQISGNSGAFLPRTAMIPFIPASFPPSMETIRLCAESFPLLMASLPFKIESFPPGAESFPVRMETIPPSAETIPVAMEAIPPSAETIPSTLESRRKLREMLIGGCNQRHSWTMGV